MSQAGADRGRTGPALPAVVSPLLWSSVALVAGVIAAGWWAPRLWAGLLGLARHGLAASLAPAALLREAADLLALAALPLLLATAAGLGALALQSGTSRSAPPHDFGPPRDSAPLPRALAVTLFTAAVVAVSLRREAPQIAALWRQPAAAAIATAAAIAARLALRTGLLLCAAGVVDHVLRRLRRAAGLSAARGPRGGRGDDAADPRLGAELLRRRGH
jgi:hypothetical protein